MVLNAVHSDISRALLSLTCSGFHYLLDSSLMCLDHLMILSGFVVQENSMYCINLHCKSD